MRLDTLANRLPFVRSAAPVPEAWLEIRRRDALADMLEERLAPIRGDVGVGEQVWSDLYSTLYLNYAEFVQGCPASEAHHHRGVAGMLDHGIEVSGLAVRACERKLLPPQGGNGRKISANQREQWMYAVVVAALLHDVGKLLVDVRVRLYDAEQGHIGLWFPVTGPMTRISKAEYYSVHYRPERKYHLHEVCSPFLVSQIAPPKGMFWLMSDLKLFGEFAAAVTGNLENAGVIGEIVRAADGQSAAASLGNDAQSPDPNAARPLHETLLMAIRDIVLNTLKINEPGAAGYVKDGDVWLVSKTILDEARRYLSGKGVSNLPANPRLMDVLTDAKRLVTTGEGKAVWSRRICLGEFDQVLTVLRIPEEKLLGEPFPGGDFEGTIEAGNDGGEKTGEAAVEEGRQKPAAPAGKGVETEDLPEPPGDVQVVASEQDNPGGGDEGKPDLGRQFVDWLVAGIREGKLAINTQKSRIHMVEGGSMFLVSPAVFQAFSQINPDWADVQKSFQRSGLCMREEGADSNLYSFTVRNRGGKLTGYLIPDAAQTLGIDNLPDANDLLERCGGGE